MLSAAARRAYRVARTLAQLGAVRTTVTRYQVGAAVHRRVLVMAVAARRANRWRAWQRSSRMIR